MQSVGDYLVPVLCFNWTSLMDAATLDGSSPRSLVERYTKNCSYAPVGPEFHQLPLMTSESQVDFGKAVVCQC